ncbi:MAG: hypothetical protein QOH87_2044 [Trebonia sp.]|nr:hypothetical protein [Trebonia sp.]
MNRVTAVAATLATATMAAAATIVPAMAAPHPAAAAPAKPAKTTTTTTHAKLASSLPTQVASELDGGKYVTIVRCQGVDSPPPVHLARPGAPLTVTGTGPSAAVFKMVNQADPYKDIYTCTVLVKEKVPAKPKPKPMAKAHKAGCEIGPGGLPGGVPGGLPGSRNGCTKKVTLDTGFGGRARQVKNHHPAG